MTTRILWIGAFALALGAQVAYAGPVAKVNGADITDAELAFADTEMKAELAGFPPESRRRALMEYLIGMHLFADEAAKDKLTSGRDFEDRLAYYKLRAIRDTYLDKLRSSISDAQAKLAYDEMITEVHARHILVKTEEEAKDILRQLKAGTDFNELAKKSADGSSALSGGDLGYFSRGQMVKVFEDTAFALEPGQVSDPVKSEFGWHVIKVEDRRNKTSPTFDEAKDQIKEALAQPQLKDTLQKLRASAAVDVLDADIKKAMDEDAKAAAADAEAKNKAAADAATQQK